MWDGLSPDICCTDRHAHTAVESLRPPWYTQSTHAHMKKKAVDISERQKTPKKQERKGASESITERHQWEKQIGKEIQNLLFTLYKNPRTQSFCLFAR